MAVFAFSRKFSLTTPSLGAGTTLTDTTFFDTGSSWASAFTPTSAQVLCLIQARSHGTVSLGTISLGATNFTSRILRSGNAIGESVSAILTATGVATGSALTFAITGSNQIGNAVIRLYNINNWAGSVGVNASNQTEAGTPSSITCTLTNLTGSNSLLVGVGGCVNGGVDPYQDTANSWTHLISADCGGLDNSDVSAGYFSKTGGAAGSNQVFTPTGSTTDDQWSCAALELLAA